MCQVWSTSGHTNVHGVPHNMLEILQNDLRSNTGADSTTRYRTRNTRHLNSSACYNESVEVTNKMQPCTRIYYSKGCRRLNMFRAAYRSSSGAPNCICSIWFIYTCGGRPLFRLSGKWIRYLDLINTNSQDT